VLTNFVHSFNFFAPNLSGEVGIFSVWKMVTLLFTIVILCFGDVKVIQETGHLFCSGVSCHVNIIIIIIVRTSDARGFFTGNPLFFTSFFTG